MILTNFPRIEVLKKEKNSQFKKIENFSFKGFRKDNSIFIPKKSALNLNFNSVNNGELTELIFFGLNYNAKREKYNRKPFLLDLQKSHKIRVKESFIGSIKTKVFKRRMLFFSFDKNNLVSLVNNLKENRPINSYSGHGLISRNERYSTKPGKIRQK